MTENNASKAPTIKVRSGNITATVWTNIIEKVDNGKTVTYSIDSIVLEKSYKDGEEWKNTNQLNTNDLSKAILVLQDVQRKLLLSE